MPKSREKTRANKKLGQEERRREEMLDRKNHFGRADPTPYQAVKNIRKKEKAGAAARGV